MYRIVAAMALSFSLSAFAQPLPAEQAEGANDAEKLVQSLRFQTGKWNVSEANATVDVTGDYRYLGAADARKVVEDLWGNPPDSSVLGLIMPKDMSPIDDGSFAVILSMDDSGYVKDEEAKSMDFSKMLKDMQESTRDGNKERQRQGYGSLELVGWAEPPHYDASSNKLYWAKELIFNGDSNHTLNYDVRILGRKGVLVMSGISGMPQLSQVSAAMQDVLKATEFNAGSRYADFNPSTDKVAAYWIGALIVGSLAAKAGLFAKLFGVLAAFWKVIAVGVVGAGASIKKFFGGKDKGGTVQ
jgi:uncharacterized membrane-anchored protein